MSKAADTAWRVRLAAVLLTLLLPLAIGEIAVRLLGHSDADLFWFHGEMIRPYNLNQVAKDLEEYRTVPGSYTAYDPDLGWSPRPSTTDQTGLYRSNSQGLRGDRDYEARPRPGVLRIAMFGDSYVHGNEVALADSLAVQVEQEIQRRGRQVEVLNFGVRGYGMDQALLRYRRDGRRFHPDVVVFGLQLENMKRNVNLFRFFLYPNHELPFSKPRFVLDGPALRLVNHPTLEVERILPTLEDFSNSPLARYETFYDAHDYQMSFYQHSKLLSILSDVTLLRMRRPNPQVAQGEGMDLTLAILKTLATEVRQDGAEFVMVYLPQARPMEYWRWLGNYGDQPILERIAQQEPVLMPTEFLERARHVGAGPLFVDGIGHFTPEGNRLVAHTLGAALATQALRH